MRELLSEDMLVLFAILALGAGVGQLSFRGISLGPAGVLFVALVIGHFGLHSPKVVTEMGLLLFVYAVGLEAAPGFFRTFRRHGARFAAIALAAVTSGAVATALVARAFSLPADLAAGLYNGALTCTPALAAALDAIERGAEGSAASITVGYGIAYPFSMIGVVLLVQFLPRLARIDLRAAEAAWKKEQQFETPSLVARHFRLENANLDGEPLRAVIATQLSTAVIARVYRGEEVHAALPDFVLNTGDVVVVVGPAEELEKMRLLLGEEVPARPALGRSGNVVSVDAEVTEEAFTGRKLADLRIWDTFGIVVTRIRRYGVELNPTGRETFEMGDILRVVGERVAVDDFVKRVEGGGRKAEETNMLPFLLGLCFGIVAGNFPIRLPSGFEVRFGAAGGAFLASLVVGHFGRIGPFRLHVPPAAKNLTRSLGLMLFLAGVGTAAGGSIVGVVREQGFRLVFAGAAISLVTVTVALALMITVLRMNPLAALGGLCACMTNPPGLASAQQLSETNLPTLSYASMYPVALIFKIILAQLLVEILPRVI